MIVGLASSKSMVLRTNAAVLSLNSARQEPGSSGRVSMLKSWEFIFLETSVSALCFQLIRWHVDIELGSDYIGLFICKNSLRLVHLTLCMLQLNKKRLKFWKSTILSKRSHYIFFKVQGGNANERTLLLVGRRTGVVIRRREEGVIFWIANNMLLLDLNGVCTMVTFSNSLNSL